jgi:hypothetical protein
MKHRLRTRGVIAALSGLVLACAFTLASALANPDMHADFSLLSCAGCHE